MAAENIQANINAHPKGDLFLGKSSLFSSQAVCVKNRCSNLFIFRAIIFRVIMFLGVIRSIPKYSPSLVFWTTSGLHACLWELW